LTSSTQVRVRPPASIPQPSDTTRDAADAALLRAQEDDRGLVVHRADVVVRVARRERSVLLDPAGAAPALGPSQESKQHMSWWPAAGTS
jgi:hypothetical protein